ncbi:MAG: peptidylprolyl isomerase, partial [Deltaproteobacteria bacterium]|nr:peptidylprolyl isomerase [Deltaproteobacteria bacterium]
MRTMHTLLVGLLLSGAVAHAEMVGRVVAVVNGEVITLADLDRAMGAHLAQILQSPDRDAAFHSVRHQALERLIDERLLRHAMTKSKIAVEPEELDLAFEGFLRDRKLTRAQLEAALRQQGLPMTQFRERMEDELRQMKFVQQELGRRVKISEQELRDYYEQHMGQFRASGKVRVAQILLPFTAGMDAAARAGLQRRAEEMARAARQGDFAALAREHSQGPKAAEGGDLGVVDPTALHPQIRRAIMRMAVGEVSAPIPSKIGYHIIKLLDRGSTTGSDFERLKDQ